MRRDGGDGGEALEVLRLSDGGEGRGEMSGAFVILVERGGDLRGAGEVWGKSRERVRHPLAEWPVEGMAQGGDGERWLRR